MNIVAIYLIELFYFAETRNLSCYQCERNSSVECEPEFLLPCPQVADQCVIHVTQQTNTGYLIKRECGLGPCGFEDDLVNRGLGMIGCDKSKAEYFCIFCCKTDGCNKNDSTGVRPSFVGFLFWAIFLLRKFKE